MTGLEEIKEMYENIKKETRQDNAVVMAKYFLEKLPKEKQMQLLSKLLSAIKYSDYRIK